MAAVEATLIVATESSPTNANANATTTATATTASSNSGQDKPMTIETASNNEQSSSSPIITSTPTSMPTETASATPPAEIASASANDCLESSPRAMQNLALVVAATSDLLETSPRSMVMLLMETPTSQAETPNSNVNLNDTPEPKAQTKPKGILRKPRYLASKQQPANNTTTNISPTTENTIQNTNHGRKNRRGDFGYGFDDDDEDSNENRNSNTAMSIVWSLIVLPVILLSYGGLPYVVVVSLAWMLIFVARWFRRFLAEEFSMRRNSTIISSSLNEIARTTNGQEQQLLPRIPTSLESPFLAPNNTKTIGPVVSSNNNSSINAATTTLPSILSEISPVAGVRSKKVRFEKGIKYPVKKFLRQPVPRIQKNRNPTPKKKNNSNNHHRNIPGSNSSSIKQPLLFASPEEENNVEGDSWSLDSLMVLRNYMKDHNNRNINISNGSNEPSSVSVMVPPSQEEEPTLGEEATQPPFQTSTENSPSSGDEADDEAEAHSDEDTAPCESVQNYSASSYSSEDEDDDKDEMLELPNSATSDGRRRQSVMFFPQEIVEEEDTAYESRYGHSYEQPAIQLYDEDDDENKYNEEETIDDFHEGLFGTTNNDSDSNLPRKNKASRYRRRKPRDSLCFTFAKKTVVPECPSIPQCPSDELEYLEQKIQEKFQQAIVIEHHYEAPATSTSASTNSEPGEAPTIVHEDSDVEPSEAISLEAPEATSLVDNTGSDLVVGNQTKTDKEPDHNHVFQLPPWKAQGGDEEIKNSATLTSGSLDDGETSVLSDVLPPTLSLDDGEDEHEFEYDYNFDYKSNIYDDIDNDQDDDEEQEEAPSHNKVNDISPPPAGCDPQQVSSNLDEEEEERKEVDEGITSTSECSNDEVQPSLVVLEEEDLPPINNVAIESDEAIIDEVSQSSVGVQDLPLDESSSNDNDTLAITNLQDLPIDTEPASMKSIGDSSQSAELLQDELSLDEEAASLPQLRQLEEEITSGGTDDAMPFTELEELTINEGTASVTDDLPIANDLQVTPADEEATSSINDVSPQFTDLEDVSLDEEAVAMSYDDLERDVLRFTNLQDLAIQELHSSFSNDEVLQISFDTMESDDVECILSPNALNMSDDETMFRDRESVVHIPFTDTKTTTFNEIDAELPNGPIIHEVLTASSDLLIEKVATHEDVECILSPLPLVDTGFTAFDESDTALPNDAIIQNELTAFTDVESKHIAPSSPESPESLGNKENAENYDDVEKMAFGKRKNSFFVDTSTTKVVEDMISSSSSAFLRSALSPTN